MKKVILIQLALILCGVTSWAQGSFQQSIGTTGKNYHDLNMEPTDDGTEDMIIAGNLFDTSMSNEEMTLLRVADDGTIIWTQSYFNTPLDKARIFDIVIDGNIYLAGSIDVSGLKQVVIAEVDISTGTLLNSVNYAILSPNFNSRALKIIATQSDADGDSVADPGFVVGGFFSDCYNLDTTCSFNNIGFVMRVDANLSPLWTVELDAPNTINNDDYDFVNGIIETSDGFFITGSATGQLTNNVQQAVLAHKINFMGAMQWDSSYVFGNSRDLSVDAYFEAATNEIYMLTNYSVSHYFGITVLSNATGAVNASKTWVGTGNDIDLYGFTLMPSSNNANNLIIAGYDRDQNWVDVNNNSQFANSSVFVYEFNKNTGVQSGTSYQYLVPHVEPTPEEFNFWNGQFPIIYFPDISFLSIATGAIIYYHVGYRTNGGLSEIELFKTGFDHRNSCENLALNIMPAAVTLQPIGVTSAGITVNPTATSIPTTPYAVSVADCMSFLSVQDIDTPDFSIYPNPVTDYLYVATTSEVNYRLLDVHGRILTEGELKVGESIFVGELSDGSYFIDLSVNDQLRTTLRFIKK
jgi:hypothetical protein